MTTSPFIKPDEAGESTSDGGTWLLDLVAAVDHLRRGIRPGLTVWDAVEEALRTDEPDWDQADPLRATLARFLDESTGPVSLGLQSAVRRWVLAAADRYNGGHYWPHPAARRGFPPAAFEVLDG